MTPGPGALLTGVPILEEVLQTHARELGADGVAYRHHAYRVLNLCVALTSRDAAVVEKIAIATAFHDLGIWTDGTFDYLGPSVRGATAYLARTGRAAWTAEVAAMIREHHKVMPHRERTGWLVEPFRRADWIDVSRGLRTFGLPRAVLAPIFGRWPNAGFHRRLLQLSLKRLASHPLSPLPMFKL